MHDYAAGRRFQKLVKDYSAAQHEAGLAATAAEELGTKGVIGGTLGALKAQAATAKKRCEGILLDLERLQAEDPGTPGPDDDARLSFLRDMFGETAARVERFEKVLKETPASAIGAGLRRTKLSQLKGELSDLGTRIRAAEHTLATEPPSPWRNLLA